MEGILGPSTAAEAVAHNPYDCAGAGCDFAADCGSPHIDFACCHLYPDLWRPAAGWQVPGGWGVGGNRALHLKERSKLLLWPNISPWAKRCAHWCKRKALATAGVGRLEADKPACTCARHSQIKTGHTLAHSLFGCVQGHMRWSLAWLDCHATLARHLLRKPLVLSEFGKQRGRRAADGGGRSQWYSQVGLRAKRGHLGQVVGGHEH